MFKIPFKSPKFILKCAKVLPLFLNEFAIKLKLKIVYNTLINIKTTS